MGRRGRKLGEEIRHKAALLNAMGHCRDAILRAQDSVTPFGVTFRACNLVKKAIDGLAHYLTGEASFYAADGSTAMPGRIRWENTGRPPKHEDHADIEDGVAEDG